MRRNRVLTTTLLALTLTAMAAQADHRSNERNRARANALDRNRDGVIALHEWPFARSAFRGFDWNGDGVLTGAEARVATIRARHPRPGMLNKEQYFRMLDTNHDGWVSRREHRGPISPFHVLDLDGNGWVSWNEWRQSRPPSAAQPWSPDLSPVDSQRLSDFLRLDRNDDEFLTRSEWRGSPFTFARLDRDHDGLVHITEYLG